jgi:hypothetical protein
MDTNKESIKLNNDCAIPYNSKTKKLLKYGKYLVVTKSGKHIVKIFNGTAFSTNDEDVTHFYTDYQKDLKDYKTKQFNVFNPELFKSYINKFSDKHKHDMLQILLKDLKLDKTVKFNVIES